eukprot:m.73233 g.73233  ORF g.73233 m.73233 type:complete len:161 (-) comp12363_c0_seq2:147-629(-)
MRLKPALALVCVWFVGVLVFVAFHQRLHPHHAPMILKQSSKEPQSITMSQLEGGVTKEVVQAGSGPTPSKGASITVHCTGYLENGKKFWSTKDPGQEVFSFQVGIGQVIKGWDVGCMTMQKGEVARLTCPGPMAYGPNGFPAWGIGPNATLTFEIEMLSF